MSRVLDIVAALIVGAAVVAVVGALSYAVFTAPQFGAGLAAILLFLWALFRVLSRWPA